MATNEEARAHKLAANQSRFRRSNERLQRGAYAHGFKASDRVPFLCECADPGCFEAVMLSMEEYERVREHPSRFVLDVTWVTQVDDCVGHAAVCELVAGHEDAEAAYERIIEAEKGYAIVEKLGAAGTATARLDERDGIS